MADPHRSTASYHSLGAISRRGYTHLRICCLTCGHSKWVPLDLVIQRMGGQSGLFDLARRACCALCGARGAHVEIAEPPTPTAGQGYVAWLERRMGWILKEGTQIRDLIHAGVEALADDPVTQHVEFWRE